MFFKPSICVLLAATACYSLCIGDATAEAPDAAKHFDEQIAPLLARRCLECHNASDAKGELDLTRSDTAIEGGKRIVTGKPDESLLWERVSGDEMPPEKPLPTAEKKLLRDWIAAGAKWGTIPIDRFRYTSDVRAGYDWWALQPIVRPEPPPVRHAQWTRSPIDAFVLFRLESLGLEPSGEADRRILIRRLTFDLTGLPPTPEEVSAFVADAQPRAYQRLVDRLLSSPHYGEHWARHWLDLARFGESNGFEFDEPRANSWPYRDWVIDAFNRDLPFDEFARLQLAGDVIAPEAPEAIKATGFLVAGAFDTAGQNQQSTAMKAVVRQDELEDIVGVVGQTFLGLTIHCARCHDHKFDPIRQVEYYRLTAALGGVRHGERDVGAPAQKIALVRRESELRNQVEEINQQIRAIDEPVRASILTERKLRTASTPRPPIPLASWEFRDGLDDPIGNLHGSLRGKAELGELGLLLDGRTAYLATVPLKKPLRAKTLEAWLSLDNLSQRGGAVIGVQTLGGEAFDAIVFGERDPGQWMAGSDNYARTRTFAGPVETETEQLVHVAIVYGEDGTVTGYRNGRPYGKPYRTSPPVTFQADQAQVLIGLRHGSAGGNRLLKGVVARAQLFDRALSAEEIALSAGTIAEFVAKPDIVARLAPDSRAARKRLDDDLQRGRTELAHPRRYACHAIAPREPGPMHLLARGDARNPLALVSAGGVASLVRPSADFGLSPEAPEAERRLALARWIASSENPLFARVIVNRVWQHHFGAGLVDTPNDFGFNGGRPSHPRLLDWLAATLIEQRWSLKQLHRTILLSATYRQTSLSNVAAARVDADNRLLWRMTPRRLQAEMMRDALLAVSGELNPAVGGPGFRDCQEVFRAGSYSYLPADPIGPEFNRRSIYRVWARGGRSGLLDAFDCPDPSTTSPKRAVTTTPLQALALLNNSFVLRMADAFAKRVEREARPTAAERIARAYQLAVGRDPDAGELDLAQRIVDKHGLSVLTRAIFNSNEFLYVD